MSHLDPDIPRKTFLKEPILDILEEKIRNEGLQGPTPFQVGFIQTLENGFNCYGHDLPRGGRSLGLAIGILQRLTLLPRNQDTRSGNLSSETKDLQVVYVCPDRDGCRDTKEVLYFLHHSSANILNHDVILSADHQMGETFEIDGDALLRWNGISGILSKPQNP